MSKKENQKRNYLKSVILNHLPNRKEDGISLRSLSQWTGINTREIKRLVQELRDDGEPICSTTYDGYWKAQISSDVNRTLQALRHQRQSLNDTITALEETYAKMQRNESNI